MENRKVKFQNISAKSWEHPTDKAALATLEKIPGLDAILKKVISSTTEKALRISTLASAVRVSEKQFPKLYAIYNEACSILDMSYIPELYVAQSPFLNARIIGVDKPFIIINSEVLDKLTDDEIMVILGHELGHCLSGHVLYKTLLHILINLPSIVLSIPIGGIAIIPILLALKEWDRKSELSADRAGQLVVQDSMASFNLLMKMSGSTDLSQMDLNEFFLQASEYENMEGISENIYKFLTLMNESHPYPVIRLSKLKSWIDSGEYEDILSGSYSKRGENDDLSDHFSSAQKSYREEMVNAKGPLGDAANTFFNAFDNVSEHASEMRDRAKSKFDKFFNDNGFNFK